MTIKSACELLLPVGNLKMCHAAIHNGADAIYVGVPEFNARGRSVDHSISDLKEMIELCHLYGVKVNLAFNVVIFEDEIKAAIDLLKEILPLSPDAIIVQDLGLAKIIRNFAPHQIIHASTQMTVTNYEAMELLDDLKIKRFVLGREVSIPEMKLIREKTNRELEVFVHGALCVAYSGQCFTSESIGGRSANRGQCAQSCRFEYEMIVDGEKKQLIDKKYLVSPHDLCGISQIPELVNLKINSFKIEGRLKTPEYVASSSKQYRKAIDHALKTQSKMSISDIDRAKKEMALTFSRGFFTGWLNGVDHQALVGGEYSSHRGFFIGIVEGISGPSSLKIKSSDLLKNGDGLMVTSAQQEEKIEIGGKIVKIVSHGNNIQEVFFHKDIKLNKIKKGFHVYLNSDVKSEQELTKTFEDKNLKKKIKIKVKIIAKIGESLKAVAADEDGHLTEVRSTSVISSAINRPTTKKIMEEEFQSLGGTIYVLTNLEVESDGEFFIHQKELKEMRREITEKLNVQRVHREETILNQNALDSLMGQSISSMKENSSQNFFSHNDQNHLNILLRSFEQVQEFVDSCRNDDSFFTKLKKVQGIIYLDFEFGKDFHPSVVLLRELKFKVGIATTRILKPAEYYNFKIIERANPDVLLIRNLGALFYFQDRPFELRGDFSLNVTNSISLNYLVGKKLKSVCASYDLNSSRLIKLLENAKPETVEVTIHQYMPSFHMEHCVFAAFLSKGHSFRDCGKPCEKHTVELRDQFGHTHFITADQECRNTMYNGTPQSAARKISEFKKYGLTEFRFEALKEKGHELKSKIEAYVDLLLADRNFSENNVILSESLFEKIGAIERYGLGEGTLSMNRDYKNRKKQ